MIEFDFDLEIVQRIAYVGSLRRIDAMRFARKHRHGYDGGDAWTIDIEGLGAEVAVTFALGLDWTPLIGATDKAGDVGDVHVRWTPRANGSLIIHPGESGPYALVTGTLPKKNVIGWIAAEDAQDANYWRDDVREPAFFVPQSALRAFPDRRVPMNRAA